LTEHSLAMREQIEGVKRAVAEAVYGRL